MTDVIVTGLPRSGSTVVSALIDQLPNVVCLNSPAWQHIFAQKNVDILPYCKWLTGDFVWVRKQLINREPLSDYRAADGTPLMDEFDPHHITHNPVMLTRPVLTGDFIVGMRHHTLYTSVLPTLVKFNHFKIIAVIRHPLEVLGSWHTLPRPLLSKGKPHGIARFWPEALEVATADIEPADCFVQLYEVYLKRYHELREHIHVVKYEDATNDPMVISRLFSIESLSAAVSYIPPRPPVHFNLAETELFRKLFRKYGVYTKLYYPDFCR